MEDRGGVFIKNALGVLNNMKYETFNEYARKNLFFMWLMSYRIIPFIAGMGTTLFFMEPFVRPALSAEEFVLYNIFARIPQSMAMGWLVANTFIKFKLEEREEERRLLEWEELEKRWEAQRKELAKWDDNYFNTTGKNKGTN